jgi:hypothetical protein
MTVLEHLLTKYLGKPRSSSGGGVSYWLCPVCDHDSFHTLPDKPQFKHRAKCWNPECKFGGDALDMLKEFHPDEPYGDRLERLALLEREFDQLNRGLGSGRGVQT